MSLKWSLTATTPDGTDTIDSGSAVKENNAWDAIERAAKKHVDQILEESERKVGELYRRCLEKQGKNPTNASFEMTEHCEETAAAAIGGIYYELWQEDPTQEVKVEVDDLWGEYDSDETVDISLAPKHVEYLIGEQLKLIGTVEAEQN